MVEGNKRRKDIRHFEKDRVFRIRQREEEEEDEKDDDKGCGERQAETGTDNPGSSVFHSGSRNYLRAARGTGSLSTKKCERRRIHELGKPASNSQSIKTMFATQ